MISMGVRQDKRINLRDLILNTLHAEFRSGIDLNMMPPHLDMNRRARAPVHRIIQITALCGLCDHRDALRSPCA